MPFRPVKFLFGCLLVFLLGSPGQFLAQYSRKADSLIILLKTAKTSTATVDSYNDLVKELKSVAPARALAYAKEGLVMARKLQDFKSQCNLLSGMAAIYNQLSLPDSAEYFLEKSLALAKRYQLDVNQVLILKDLGDLYRSTGRFDKALACYEELEEGARKARLADVYASSLLGRGIVHRNKNNTVKTLEYLQKAVSIFDTMPPKKEYANALTGIGLVYNEMKQTEKANEIYDKVIKLYRAIYPSQLESRDFYGAASAFLSMGAIFNDQFEIDSALSYFNKAIALSKTYDLKKTLALAYFKTGESYFRRNQIGPSEKKYLEALKIYGSLGNQLGKSYVLNSLCNLYEKTNNFAKARPVVSEAISIAETLGDSLKLRELYLKAAVLYAQSGDYKNAYTYRIMYETINNRIYNSQNSKVMSEMLARYEAGAKEKENIMLQKENELSQKIIRQQKLQNYFIIGGVMLVLLLIFFIVRGLKLQRDNFSLAVKEQKAQLSRLKEMKTLAELKTLQARINPHFLYNSLNSITALIHEKPEQAEEMTIKLSRLFRYSINTQEANWSTVKEELAIVQTYLDIERVRFGDRIRFEVNADEAITNTMIPRFLIQPLVENALKHGLKNTQSDGCLIVNIKDRKSDIEISVHDNGTPFPDQLLAGYGLQSINDKLSLLCGEAWTISYVNSGQKQIKIQLPKFTNA